MPWTPQHDALYLHLAVACIDGGINTREQVAIADVLPGLREERGAQATLLDAVTDQLLEVGDSLVMFFQVCCARLAEQLSPSRRLELLCSLHRVAVADERRLRPAEVVMLRMAIVILDLAEQASVSPSGRLVRRFTPSASPATA